MRQTSLLLASVCSALLSVMPADAQTVGVSAAVNQNAQGIRPGAGIRTIVLGDNVVYNERIETDTVGLLQILLADGTAFTVGPNSAISIDRFVYDPAAGTAEVTASLTKGVFRFIGGKTSKTPGGVKLNTPVGTIGIRGAMVTMGFGGGRQGSGAVTSHIDLGFGKEVTLDSPGGETQRIFKPGYSIIITKNADGSEKREVRRTPPGLANEVQSQLSGAPGTSGGASEKPTDPVVIVSGISTENSDRPPVENVPVPTARPADVNQTTPDEDVVQEASTDLVRQEVQTEVANSAVVVAPIPDPGPPLTPARTMPVRFITAGSTYTTNDGRVSSSPGSVGLVGGSPDNDEVVSLTVSQDGTSATAATRQGTLTVPLFSASNFSAQPILTASGASLNGTPLSGTAYVDADGFTAYALSPNSDGTQPIYIIAGSPTESLDVLLTGDVRRYTYSPDLIQGIPVPFMSSDALGTDYSGVSNTDFFVVEQGANGTNGPLIFQSWLKISGVGASQVSAIGANIGAISGVDGSAHFDFGRRGSYRNDALSTSYHLFGGIDSVAGATGGNALFGRNAQNLVLSNDLTNRQVFNDDSSDETTPIFGSLHVLGLQEEKSLQEFTADRGTTRSLEGRAITGFSAAIEEGVDSSGLNRIYNLTSGSDPSNTLLYFDGVQNTMGGEIVVGDADIRDHFAFGQGIGSNTAFGDSAYVDDDLFGAAENTNPDRIYLTDLDGSGNVRNVFPLVEGQRGNSYLISGDALPQPELLPVSNGIPAGKICQCDFLEWGWWGAQIRASASDGTDPDQEAVRASVHLGTWVAGDITTTTQLAPLAGAGSSATYEGRAVGNVTSSDVNGTANYVAAGLMDMSYDFGARTGTMTIQNFDGRNFGASLSGAATGLATFDGPLAQSNVALNGSAAANGGLQGAFVNDGTAIAQGVIGNFSVTNGTDWSAVGITAGNQTSLVP